MIEFAFVAPVLLLIMFAVIEYSVMFGAMILMNNVTGQAARQAAVIQPGFSANDYATDAVSFMTAQMPDYIAGFKDRLVLTSDVVDCNGQTCLNIKVTYPNYATTPLVAGYLSALGLLPDSLSAEAVSRLSITAVGL